MYGSTKKKRENDVTKFLSRIQNSTITPPSPPPTKHLGFFFVGIKTSNFCSRCHKQNHRMRKNSSNI